jgi:hypothetical protein
MRQDQIDALMDAAKQPLARIVAANGDILFVASEGGAEEDALIVARERARRALNKEFDQDPVYRERVIALMQRTAAPEAQPSAEPIAADAATADAALNKDLADSLASRAGIGSPPLNRMFDMGKGDDE